MEQIFFSTNTDHSPLLTVMAVTLIAWFGLALYIFQLDRKIKKLEKELDEL